MGYAQFFGGIDLAETQESANFLTALTSNVILV
jgi:hypothetical protein